MQSVTDAQRIILETTRPVGHERLFLGDATGRVLASDVTSRRNLPPHDNSAMDGYGVRASDIVSASEQEPVALDVVGAVRPGQAPEMPALGAGEAVRIMTGAPIPAGVDCVVMRENTDETSVGEASGTVRIKKAEPAGTAIRKRGEDIGKDRVVAAAGTRVRPAVLNLIAQAGHSVRRRGASAHGGDFGPQGDELKELGSIITSDDIVNSNAHAIGAAIERLGGIAQRVGIARDSLDDHVQAHQRRNLRRRARDHRGRIHGDPRLCSARAR